MESDNNSCTKFDILNVYYVDTLLHNLPSLVDISDRHGYSMCEGNRSEV